MALGVVRTVLDPSIHGDAYADNPYLYSPALATWNQFQIGDKGDDKRLLESNTVVDEGASSKPDAEVRTKLSIPVDAAGRRKHFQHEASRKAFDFEPGRVYMADFGNQYLNFAGEFWTIGIHKKDHG